LVKRFYRVRVKLCKTAVISMIKNWRIWVIVANWIISPYWYVIALFISMSSEQIRLGNVSIHGPLDIIATIFILAMFMFPILVSLMIHDTVWMLLYYSISGTILYVTYRQYKKWKVSKAIKHERNRSKNS